MEILLSNNLGFNWEKYDSSQTIYIKGYFEDEKIVIDQLKQVSSFEEFISVIQMIRGSFAIIVKSNDCVWAATDLARSFPVFFDIDCNYLSDAAETIRSRLPLNESSVDHLLFAEMLSKRNTAAGHTVYKQIKQLIAGEAVQFRGNEVKRRLYYAHRRHPSLEKEDVLRIKFKIVSERMMERIVPETFSGNIIVPLSGGYDSRFIACLLKDRGFINVICYTYGRPSDYEVINSRLVAEKLGFQWHCVEYTRSDWQSFFDSSDAKLYFEETHNHCNLPHVQEFIALQNLKMKNIIHAGDIVIPGFCGDFPAGSFSNVPKYETYNITNLADYIYDEHYINVKYKHSLELKLKDEIKKFISEHGFEISDRSSFISAYEFWVIQTRLSMWVVNSLRVYEHFGLQWRIPMWRREYLDFWNSVPDDLRLNCSFYRECLMDTVFKKYDVLMRKPNPSSTHSNYIKSLLANSVKRVLIFISVKSGRDFYRRNNLNDYNEASIIMLRSMKTRKHYRYNSLSVHLVEQLWWCQKKYGVTTYLKVFNDIQ